MQTGNFQLVRQINRRLVFGLIREGEQVSRASLAEVTALSKATVSAVVDELIEGGMIVEGPRMVGSIGRRPILLDINTGGPVLGAVQLEPDGVRGAVMDLRWRILKRFSRPCAPAKGESLIRAAVDTLAAIKNYATVMGRLVLGAGVGVPGILNRPGDVVLHAPALGWRDVSLRKVLETVVDFPVSLGDEARLGALAEVAVGSGRGTEVLLYLGLGTTVSVGIVRRGCLEGGTHAGHLTVLPAGPPCWCGNRGCLEALVGEENLVRRAREMLAAGRRFRRAPAGLSRQWLCREAEKGDPLATEILLEACRWVGIGLANLINLYQPEMVLIGGWMASDRKLMLAVEKEVRERALAAFMRPMRIEPAGITEDAVLIGAAAWALEGALGSQPIQGLS